MVRALNRLPDVLLYIEPGFTLNERPSKQRGSNARLTMTRRRERSLERVVGMFESSIHIMPDR